MKEKAEKSRRDEILKNTCITSIQLLEEIPNSHRDSDDQENNPLEVNSQFILLPLERIHYPLKEQYNELQSLI